MKSLEPMQKVIARLARLPGVGRRSAERMAYRVATDRKGLARDLAHALTELDETVVCCSMCGNLTLKTQDPCPLCTDPKRDQSQLCVVEDPQSIQQLEAAGSYRGLYFCMMGKLSPIQGQDIPPAQVTALLSRIREGTVREVILAFDSDVESDATTSFLHQQLEELGVQVTRLAFGIPAGSGIAYADPVTLARAMHGRQSYET